MKINNFCEELEKILEEKYFPEENIKTTDFINAMRSWLIDSDGGKNFFDDLCDDKISFRDLVKLIRAAGMYE